MSMFEKRTHPAVTILSLAIIVLTCLFFLLPILTWDRDDIRQREDGGDNRYSGTLSPRLWGPALTVRADCSSYGDAVEIAQVPVAAADPDFTHTLELIQAVPAGGKSAYRYTFALEEGTDTVYLAPPVLQIPVDISPVSLPLKDGGEPLTARLDGADWFTVSSLLLHSTPRQDGDGQLYTVTLTLDFAQEILLCNPQVEINGQRVRASSWTVLQSSGVGGSIGKNALDTGQLTFSFPAESDEAALSILAGASLIAEEAAVRTEAEDAVFSASMSDVEIVVTGRQADT